MLDRKIKDIDASIELLEDRKKSIKYIVYGCILIASIGAMIGFVSSIFDEPVIGAIATGTALVTVFVALIESLDVGQYNILIYLKRQFEK